MEYMLMISLEPFTCYFLHVNFFNKGAFINPLCCNGLIKILYPSGHFKPRGRFTADCF